MIPRKLIELRTWGVELNLPKDFPVNDENFLETLELVMKKSYANGNKRLLVDLTNYTLDINPSDLEKTIKVLRSFMTRGVIIANFSANLEKKINTFYKEHTFIRGGVLIGHFTTRVKAKDWLLSKD